MSEQLYSHKFFRSWFCRTRVIAGYPIYVTGLSGRDPVQDLCLAFKTSLKTSAPASHFTPTGSELDGPGPADGLFPSTVFRLWSSLLRKSWGHYPLFSPFSSCAPFSGHQLNSSHAKEGEVVAETTEGASSSSLPGGRALLVLWGKLLLQPLLRPTVNSPLGDQQ